ncbi:hypothetical protein [Nostoc sp.]|uniref:hypothetical protein n=1 Tax=Nostoc sp. TaxID=1180 RepID=UPI002FF989CD
MKIECYSLTLAHQFCQVAHRYLIGRYILITNPSEVFSDRQIAKTSTSANLSGSDPFTLEKIIGRCTLITHSPVG